MGDVPTPTHTQANTLCYNYPVTTQIPLDVKTYVYMCISITHQRTHYFISSTLTLPKKQKQNNIDDICRYMYMYMYLDTCNDMLYTPVM